MDAHGGVNETAKVLAQVWDQTLEIIEKSQFKNVPYFKNSGGWPDIDFDVSEKK